MESPSFDRVFRQMAGRVRRRRMLRSVLSGAALGAVAGAFAALVAWRAGAGELRFAATALTLVGVVAGWVRGRRRRWSDAEVALFLDARLEAEESFTTGVLAHDAAPEAANAARGRAVAHAARAPVRRVRPRVWLRHHALIPVGLAGIAALAWLPPPPRPAAPPPERGRELVQAKDVPGLERLEALAHAPSLSAADAARLQALAREAKALSDDLRRGIERREAQARIAELRDGLSGERARFGGGSERPGLEAALRALEADRSLFRARRALAEGDIVGFDDAMRELANQAEDEARQKAREALAEAERAARERGGKHLAELLERQRRLFAEREALNRALRELGEQLDGAADAELDAFFGGADPEAAERLAEALARAYAGLNEEERRQLLEQLRRHLEQGSGPSPADPAELEAWLERLDTPEGQRALREALKQAARGRDAERERALDDAERGAAEAERSLGVPLPLPGAGRPGESPSPPGAPGSPSREGAGGPGPGGGADDHAGETPPLDVPELRAKADARVLPGVPLEGRGFGRAPALGGETAAQPGTGEVGAARPGAIGAIEGSDVPEDYREHVGRYFEP